MGNSSSPNDISTGVDVIEVAAAATYDGSNGVARMLIPLTDGTATITTLANVSRSFSVLQGVAVTVGVKSTSGTGNPKMLLVF